jgi:hypothetical protein
MNHFYHVKKIQLINVINKFRLTKNIEYFKTYFKTNIEY